MSTRSSAFTLIELLVVIAIIGILAAVGTVAYSGYVSSAKKSATENAMQQISLAQTEEYSNTGEYFTSKKSCGDPDTETSDEIEVRLFGGADIITKESDYEMCVALEGESSYIIRASNGKKIITLSANGVWTGK